MSTAIFHPMVVLVLWTFAALFMRRRFKARIPNRNLVNLLEMPVLFYVACLTVYVIGKVDLWSVGLAWAYVLLRIAHSLVHLSYNNVIHRMRVYALGIFVLLALWLRILAVL